MKDDVVHDFARADPLRGCWRRVNNRISEEQAEEICRLVAGGMSFRAVGRRLGISHGVVSRLWRKGGTRRPITVKKGGAPPRSGWDAMIGAKINGAFVQAAMIRL